MDAVRKRGRLLNGVGYIRAVETKVRLKSKMTRASLGFISKRTGNGMLNKVIRVFKFLFFKKTYTVYRNGNRTYKGESKWQAERAFSFNNRYCEYTGQGHSQLICSCGRDIMYIKSRRIC